VAEGGLNTSAAENASLVHLIVIEKGRLKFLYRFEIPMPLMNEKTKQKS